MTTAVAARTKDRKPPPSRRIAPAPPLLQNIGESFLDIAATAGAMGVLAYGIVSRCVTFRFDYAELKRNLYRMGVKSIPIVIVTALFTGAIMVIQAAPLEQRFGAQGLHCWGAGFGTLREIAPCSRRS